MIKQRNDFDCGVAAFANLLTIGYEDAKKALHGRNPAVNLHEGQAIGIHLGEFSRALFEMHKLHVVVPFVRSRANGIKHWHDRTSVYTLRELDQQLKGRRAILAVDSLNSRDALHWITWRNGEVLDPSTKKTYETGDLLPVHSAIIMGF